MRPYRMSAMIANMRYRIGSAIGYLVLMSTWVYGLEERGHPASGALVVALVFVAPLAVGLLTGSWLALLLPGAVVLISIPAGYPPDAELPYWFGFMFFAVVALPLIAAGVVARWLANRYAPQGQS